jgi:hypothetical protein
MVKPMKDTKSNTCTCGAWAKPDTRHSSSCPWVESQDTTGELDQIILNFAKRVEAMPRGKTYGWDDEKAAIQAYADKQAQHIHQFSYVYDPYEKCKYCLCTYQELAELTKAKKGQQ